MKFCEYWGYERAQDAAWLTEGFALPGTLPVCQIRAGLHLRGLGPAEDALPGLCGVA